MTYKFYWLVNRTGSVGPDYFVNISRKVKSAKNRRKSFFPIVGRPEESGTLLAEAYGDPNRQGSLFPAFVRLTPIQTQTNKRDILFAACNQSANQLMAAAKLRLCGRRTDTQTYLAHERRAIWSWNWRKSVSFLA